MARYREKDTRAMKAAAVAGAYLVGVAVLFTLQLGQAIVVPVPFAVSAPPLVYAALSVVMLRGEPFVRRLSWIGSACLVHLLLGMAAAVELMWAGGLGVVHALAEVFVLFAPAPALTLLATPLVLAAMRSAAPRPTSRPEPPAPRQQAPANGTRQRSFARAGARGSGRPSEPGTASAPAVAPAAAAPAPGRAFAHPASPAPPRAAAPASRPAVQAPPPAVEPPPLREARPAEASRPTRPAPAPAHGSGDVVRIPFDHIAPQLPAEAFVLPFDRLGESLREPHTLLIPRRVVMARMRDGAILIDWAVVAPQFPDLALGMSEVDFRNRYPDLKLSLPVDEVLRQLPPDAASPASPAERLEPPLPPSTNGRSGAAHALVGEPVASPAAAATTAVVAGAPGGRSPDARVDPQTLARIAGCFSGAGTFEAAAESSAGATLVVLAAPGLPRAAVAARAARLMRCFAAASAIVTVRSARAVLVLAPGPIPIVVAAPRPGAPVALLELRAARAAAPFGDATAMAPPATHRSLEALAVDGRVAGAGDALGSFGVVEPTVFADGAARVYVFSAPGQDAMSIGQLALCVCEALRDEGTELGPLLSVVIQRGRERTLVRPFGRGGGVLAATGPVTRPGRAHRDADRAATVLEAL